MLEAFKIILENCIREEKDICKANVCEGLSCHLCPFMNNESKQKTVNYINNKKLS